MCALTVSSVGDISFAGGFADQASLVHSWIDKELVDFLDADIRIANLECVFLPPGEPRPGGLCLAEPAEALDALRYARFNVVSLGNNHVLDFKGEQGMLETTRLLDESGIAHCGAGRNLEEAARPAVIEAGAIKVAVFSRLHDHSFIDVSPIVAGPHKPGVALLDMREILGSIHEYKQTGACDLAVLCLHWGMQNLHDHSPLVHDLGRELLRGGADLILGSHSHVLQGLARMDGKYCFYGQGNFYFYPYPLKDFPGGLLYGPEAVRHRISAASKFTWSDGEWTADLAVAVQRGDERIGFLENRAAKRMSKLALKIWSRRRPLCYGYYWRLEVLKKHLGRMRKALNGSCRESREWYGNPLNWIKIIRDLLNPRSLG